MQRVDVRQRQRLANQADLGLWFPLPYSLGVALHETGWQLRAGPPMLKGLASTLTCTQWRLLTCGDLGRRHYVVVIVSGGIAVGFARCLARCMRRSGQGLPCVGGGGVVLWSHHGACLCPWTCEVRCCCMHTCIQWCKLWPHHLECNIKCQKVPDPQC